ncbi:putative oligopeptide transporter [Melampsora larici-populina 98AG31]|uniref:Putative oligopeptide transporter n=1 Tax=Melampsora larici-populina (strain 98AG31 / pathotype 3-4-7) TaxID=747676 RepID=F4RNZ6_MELLP|nr:putative oligopeptide transporter [Melampsora larici-populina 98AG31]EGG05733.1 putative oligopeptide transporter [Melampsora larici-populina 98AG31]
MVMSLRKTQTPPVDESRGHFGVVRDSEPPIQHQDSFFPHIDEDQSLGEGDSSSFLDATLAPSRSRSFRSSGERTYSSRLDHPQEKTSLAGQDDTEKARSENASVKSDGTREHIPSEVHMFSLEDDSSLPVMTVRSILVGILEGILGAAVTQLFMFKPVHLRLQPLFLQITSMLLGRGLALIPGPKWWNPGPFSIKETTFASIMSTSASVGAFAIEMLAAKDLYFDQVSSLGVSLLVLLSSQMIGYGWAGLLQPILVYPAQVVYPDVLPSVALFHSLHGEGQHTKDQLSFFKKAFFSMGFYEIFPTYIAPAFQAISFFCLTLPPNPLITNLFGGAKPFEGLGFLNISGDWALIGAHGPFFTPLSAQFHHISWFDAGVAQNFPFLSVSLLTAQGTPYPIKKVINGDGTPNEDAITQIGLPSFTSTYVIAQVFASLAAASAITHVLLYNYKIILQLFKRKGNAEGIDPHRIVCQKYRDFPVWGFCLISLISIGMALGASALDKSGLSPLGLLVAIAISGLLTLAVGFLTAITGFHLNMNGVVQMLGGLMFPGNAYGNMYFTTFGASTVAQSMNMIKDLKLGQYMHISQSMVVISQLIGTLVGALVNYAMMKALIGSQREVLLLPNGNGVFSGFAIAAFESHAVSWGAFSTKLFMANQRYVAIPAALGVGLFLPIPIFMAHKYWPRLKLNLINVPLVTGSISSGYSGATAGRFVNIIIGLMSQFYARRYLPEWFKKYNYVCSAALDGGAQIVILILAIFFQGGAGYQVHFPTYFLNPDPSIPKDYCYMAPQASQKAE